MASNSTWAAKQNKLFENALATFDKDAPDRFHHLAKAVGGKTVEEVKRHYDMLVDDLNHIESGKVPLPKYSSNGNISNNNRGHQYMDEEQRMKYLKLQ